MIDGQVFVTLTVGEFYTGRYGGQSHELSPTYWGQITKNQKPTAYVTDTWSAGALKVCRIMKLYF